VSLTAVPPRSREALAAVRSGHAKVYGTQRPGHAGYRKAVEFGDPESAVLDLGVDLPVYVAAAGDEVLDRVQGVLQARHPASLVPPMLEEEELSGGLERTPQLPEGVPEPCDRTQRPGARHRGEMLVRKRESVGGVVNHALDGEGGSGDAGAYAAFEYGRGVDPRDAANRCRIAFEIQARTKADFEHVAPRTCEYPAPVSAMHVATEPALHETREDVFRVQPHLLSPAR